MEDGDSDQPEKKRPHLESDSYAMARHPSSSPPDNKTIDAAVLQCQNQKLVQQLDGQKNELHDLEEKMKELKDKQAAYDSILINVNQLWNRLDDDLILLRVRAGAGQSALEGLDQLDHSRGSIPSCKAEETFLCRLLQTDSIQSNGNDGSLKFVREALSMRVSVTKELMKFLEETISVQRAKAESIAQALQGKSSAEDAVIQISKVENLMKEEAACLQGAIDALHLKHKDYSDRIQSYINSHSVDQSEIKLLAGELEECMVQLEESRRKLVSMKTQEGMASGVHTPSAGAANGNLSPEKPANRTMRLRELKDSIEETKILAADRLSELQDAQEDDRNLSKQLQGLQDELKDEKYVKSSRLYSLLNDQLQHWNAQLERYRGLADSLQADRSSITRKENELSSKTESIDVARNAIKDVESKVEELQLQLKNCVIEKNGVEVKMEETLQDSGRKDIKDEFHVMASALSKELGMMEAQLNRWKETAHEALSLREEAKSLKALLDKKAIEQKRLAEIFDEEALHIKSLKALIEKKQKEKLEIQILLDMMGQQIYDSRDIMEIKDSEQRARLQAEHLRNALEEHGLELRIRAANEAESACQERLRRAEAEIAELRAISDVYDRDVLELKEAVKMKDVEAEAYISEIETIGQAYEDMQTQHQHLLQQVTDRDDYNLKLVSESVKTKQAQSLLLSEKQGLEIQLQQIHRTLESTKLRISDSEELMKACVREAVDSSQEDRHLAVSLETAKWELAEAEKEARWLKSAVSSSEKEYEQIQRKMEETRKELENERSERNKLDEELVELNRQVAEMSSENGEAAIQKLQDEIKNCKAILKCGVCFDRPKEVVIVKCFHLFCHPCIQRNLEIRHRKCPGCGTAFGQSDVRFVKI